MAEDLGTIRIDFGDPGRGPEATKAASASAAAAGGFKVSDLTALAGEIYAPIVAGVQKVADVISGLVRYVQDGISQITEATRYGGEGLSESIQLNIQQLRQQFGQAQVLGPLYAMVLKWYREIMQLLYPWRLFLSAIMTAVTGTIVAALKALAPILKAGFTGLIYATATLSDAITKSLQQAAKPGGFTTAMREYGREFVTASFVEAQRGRPIAQFLAAMIGSGLLQSAGVAETFAGSMTEINTELQKALKELKDINANTKKDFEDNLWINTQLRDLAAKSPLYPQRDTPGLPQPEFWHPPGSTYGTR